MRSEWSCWRQRAIGEENPAERAVEIYLIGMKKDTEEFLILSRAKPKRAGAPQVEDYFRIARPITIGNWTRLPTWK
jgi:hypothetical protein